MLSLPRRLQVGYIVSRRPGVAPTAGLPIYVAVPAVTHAVLAQADFRGWCGPSRTAMGSRQALLLLVFRMEVTEPSTTDKLEAIVKSMCLGFCRLSPDGHAPPVDTVVMDMAKVRWQEECMRTDKWLGDHPQGRVALIFVGEGTTSGGLTFGKSAREGKDPIQVCLALFRRCLTLTSAKQHAREVLGEATWKKVFLRDCFAMLLPLSSSDQAWAAAVVKNWLVETPYIQ